MYKRSYYTEITDSLDINVGVSGRLLFATRTGALLLINDDDYPSFSENKFDQIPKELFDTLIEAEAIVPLDEDELSSIINDNNKTILNNGVLDIVIQPGASCQLGCHYCGQQHSKHYMDEKTQKNLIKRIKSNIEKSNCSKILITWYGAEPLMALNHIYNISEELIKICDEKGVEYTSIMVTNGLSLKNEIFKKLSSDCKIGTFQVTLDGIAEYHDRNRYLKKDQGPSFSIIFNNLLTIVNDSSYLEKDARILIRCNVDTNNVEGLNAFIDLLDEHNLQSKIGFYLVPIHNWGDNGIENTKGVEKDDFSVLEIDWMINLLKRGFNTDILPERTKIICSAVKPQSEVYDAFGNISTCWEVPYTSLFSNTKFEIGNLNTTFFSDKADVPLRNWNNDIKDGKSMSPCAKCTLLPVCGGGCPIHWVSGTPACPPFKFNIKDRMVLEYLNSKLLIS